MSRDDDLVISCRCGCTEIATRGGYSTQTMKDVAELGLAASTLCRRKRYRRILWRWIAGSLLVGALVTGAVMWREAAKTERAASYCRQGEEQLDTYKDDHKAVEMFTKSLAVKPSPLVYNFRSFAHWRLRDFKAALADADAALAIDPTNEAAKENRELFKGAMGNPACGSPSR